MTDTSDLWAVYDRNAAPGSPRYHQARENGKLYALKSDEPTFMPEEDARVFLRDPAFVVISSQNVRIPSLPEQAKMNQSGSGITLGPDEVVANLSELTYEALLARAGARGGSETLGKRPKRDDLIEFLRRAPVTKAAPPEERGSPPLPDPDLDEDALPADVAAKMLNAPSLDAVLAGR
jgi:hypothetical protein